MKKKILQERAKKYEEVMFEQFKKDKEVADHEMAITARQFLKNKRELRIVKKVINR